ncbi:MAG: T9SS type A sorting domain-containing protein, partial [Chitinophagales bacterium]
VTNTWIEKTDLAGTERFWAVGFSIGSNGYIGTGYNDNQGYKNDFWEYTLENTSPTCAIPTTFSAFNITHNTAKLKWLNINDALSYKIRYKTTGTSEWTLTKSTENHKNLNGLAASTEYVWQVKSFCEINPVVASDWSAKQFFTTAPLRIYSVNVEATVLEIYPNPSSGNSTLHLILTQSSLVTIKIFDVNGKEISTVLNEIYEAGDHSLPINTTSFAKGIYLVQMISADGIQNQKLLLQ